MTEISIKKNSLMNNAIFHGVSFNSKTRSAHNFSYEEMDRELKDEDVFSWIDIEGPDIEALNDVLRRFDIDLVLVGHFKEPEVLPRIVERSDSLAFYLYEIVNPEKHLDTSHELTEIEFERMLLVLGSDFVITYHRSKLDAVDYVKGCCKENFIFAGKTPGFIVFLFLQRCLYDYAHLNLANDNYIDLLEANVLSGSHMELTAKISVAGTNILTLKKLAASLHIVLMLVVTKLNPFISDQARESFSQMLQNAVAIRASIDSSRDLLDGVVNNLQTVATTRTNEIARVLTVISGIILPLTLISGIYGMNFDNMPETRHPMGYFLVLLFMAIVAAILLIIFYRLGWIGTGRSKFPRQ